MGLASKFGGFFSLSDDDNKNENGNSELQEGVISSQLPELKVNTPDDELLKLTKDWKKKWDRHNGDLRDRQDQNENYWLGEHDEQFLDNGSNGQTLHSDRGVGGLLRNHTATDNLIFEALETFLPQATRRSPDPVVTSDNTPEGKELADKVRKMLIHLADLIHLRLKIKSVTRNWALAFLGVAKVGWNLEENQIETVVLRAQKLILDPTATISVAGVYTGEYIGEYREKSAADLVVDFPSKANFIKAMSGGKMGTMIRYIEWWAANGDILFWTLKGEVLEKVKNPHWNYPGEETTIDEFGGAFTEETEAFNHFTTPQCPYVFLSVFNLGLHPHDDTSLISQNLGNQDLINKRYRQIDDNVDGMNGGWVISGQNSGMTFEQSSSVIQAFRDGKGVWIPEGTPSSAIQRMVGTGLPADVFNSLQDSRNELRGIFGIQGSTPQGINQEKTVRGKILATNQDSTRIGGGVSEYIEQFADRIYNWWTQLMFVYYDEEQIASIIGRGGSQEFITLQSSDLNRKLLVSVKEGSMIPKDPLTEANQAVELFGQGAIGPIELHKRLDSPNPEEIVTEAIQFATNPAALVGGNADAVPTEGGEAQATNQSLLGQVPVQQ